MNHVLKIGAALGLAALGLTGLPAAQAQVAPTVINGTLTEDDDVSAVFSFTVTTPGTVQLFTTSYGGGMNVDGSTTAAGGFDPILTLFDASGNYIDDNDDGPNAAIDPATITESNPFGNAYDSALQETLAPGTYQVAVTEFDNFSNADPYVGDGFSTNLADGFTEEGYGNFTAAMFADSGGQNNGVSFIDYSGNQRTSSFTLDIGNGPLQPVPEASTTVSFGLLLMLGLGGAAIRARRKARTQAT